MTAEIQEFLRKNRSKGNVSAYRAYQREIAELIDHGASLPVIVTFLVEIKGVDANAGALWAFLSREVRRLSRNDSKLDIAKQFAAAVRTGSEARTSLVAACERQAAPPPALNPVELHQARRTDALKGGGIQTSSRPGAIATDQLDTAAREIRPDFDTLDLDTKAEISAQARINMCRMPDSEKGTQDYKEILRLLQKPGAAPGAS